MAPPPQALSDKDDDKFPAQQLFVLGLLHPNTNLSARSSLTVQQQVYVGLLNPLPLLPS